MEKVIDFKLVGYLVIIDRNDYDVIYFLHKEVKPLDYYKKYVEEHYNDFAKDIDVSIHEIWQADSDDFDFTHCGVFLDEAFPIVEQEVELPKNFYLKNIENHKIEMIRTEFNEVEYLMEEWDEWNEHLFNFNGASWLVSKNSLEKLKELIGKLEKFAD